MKVVGCAGRQPWRFVSLQPKQHDRGRPRLRVDLREREDPSAGVPRSRDMPAVAVGKTLGLAGPVNVLPIQIPTADCDASELKTIRRPSGVHTGSPAPESNVSARQRVAGPVVGPHVVLCAVEEVEREPTAIRCKPWMQPSRRRRPQGR